MRDRCPHRLVPLSAGPVVDDQLECAYHGYRFDGTGRTTFIPALPDGAPIPPKACVDTAPVALRFGLVWICLDADPLDDLLDDAGYVDPGNDLFVAGPFTTRVSAAILADNFLDAAHFPFLHRDDVRRLRRRPAPLRGQALGWRLHQTTADRRRRPPRRAVDSASGLRGGRPVQRRAAPRPPRRIRLHLVVRLPGRRRHLRSGGWSTPTRSAGTPSRSPPPRPADRRGPRGPVDPRADGGPAVPLDVRTEVHTKADPGCLEYRRMLAELAGQVPAASDAPPARVGGAPL